MYNIKKLNTISSAVYDHLPKTNYTVSSHIEEGEADAFLVRSADCHEMNLDDSRILAFARAGAGVNNIPVDECAKKGIVVFNTPGANANGVKEMVLCALIMASRNVIPAVTWAQTLRDKGDEIGKLVEKGKSQFVGPEIKGKTIGVIGLGAIGVMVANAAASIGMNVIGYDPFISVESAWHLSRAVHRALSLDALLTKSDYITVHIPLMEKTKGFINAHELEKVKPGVVLLNFARNGIIDESDLIEALDNGRVSQYVTDFPTKTVIAHEKVLAIPHLGASTPESEENCAVMAASQLRQYIEVGSIKNSVNMPECILGAPAHFRLALIHKNLPNMVGQMTAILAKADINIEEMVNKSRGEAAYTVFDLNKTPDQAIIDQLASIENMFKIRQISHE